MFGAGLCYGMSALSPPLSSWHHFLSTMKNCCEGTSVPAHRGLVRRLLYALVATVLVFVLWRKWPQPNTY